MGSKLHRGNTAKENTDSNKTGIMMTLRWVGVRSDAHRRQQAQLAVYKRNCQQAKIWTFDPASAKKQKTAAAAIEKSKTTATATIEKKEMEVATAAKNKTAETAKERLKEEDVVARAEAATDIQAVMRATSSMTGAADKSFDPWVAVEYKDPWKIRRTARQKEIAFYRTPTFYTAYQRKQERYEYETRLRIRRDLGYQSNLTLFILD